MGKRAKGQLEDHGARGRSRPRAVAEFVFTIDELAAYLKLAKSTTYKLAQEGKIPGQKVGRHWRFHRAVIDRWLGDEHAPDHA